MFKYIYSYIKKYKYTCSLILCFAVILNVANIALPYIFGKLIDAMIGGSKFDHIKKYIMIIFMISFVRIIISYWYNIRFSVYSSKISFDISERSITRLQKTSYNNIIGKDIVYLIHRIQMDSSVLSEFILRGVINFIINIVNTITILLILLKLNKLIFFIVLFCTPLYIFIYVMFKDKLYKTNLSFRECQSEYFSTLNEQLTNFKFIKINVLYEYLNEKLRKGFNNLLNNLTNNVKVNFWFDNIASIITQVANIVLVIVGGIEVFSKRLSIGVFSILNNYFSTLFQNITSLLQFGAYYQQVKIAYNRIKDIEDLSEENNGTKKIESIDTITLKNVSMSYSNSQIISNLNLEFNKGNLYLIKGTNGCGKSTLIHMIASIIDSYEGEIRINNNDIKSLDMRHTRKNYISFMDQNGVVLKDTVFENIKLNNTVVNSINQVQSSIEGLGLKSFLCDLIKVNKVIDKDTISGGERQKISLIRNIMKDGELFILDEPENSLDTGSVEKLIKFIESIKDKKIIIIITHDERFDDIADKVIDLTRNSIEEKSKNIS